jgi:hypothetical protein
MKRMTEMVGVKREK